VHEGEEAAQPARERCADLARELAACRAQLARSQAVAHIGSWEWDVATDRVTWSAEMYRIFGLTDQTFSGSVAEVLARVHKDDVGQLAVYRAEVLAGTPRPHYAFRILYQNGEVRALRATVDEMVADATGQPCCVVGVVQDVTERTQVEEALRDSEARYRAFSEATSEGIALTEHGRIIAVNETFTAHLGFAAEEMLGHSPLEFTAPESREEMARRYLAGDPGPYTAISLHKDGSRTIGELRARNITYKGRPVRVVAVREITAQKRAEDALRASEAKFRSLFEHMTESVTIDEMVLDADGRPIDWIVRDANPAYERIFQIPRMQAIGQRATHLYPFIEQLRLEFEAHARQLERGDTVLMEFADTNTGKHLLVSAIPMGAHHFATVATDITERKVAEAERERLLREVERRAAELDAALNSIADGVVIVAPDGTIARINSTAERLSGFTVGISVSPPEPAQTIPGMQTPDGLPITLAHMPPIRALRGETVRGELLMFQPPLVPQPIWVSVSAAPLQLPDGTQLGAVVTITDITLLHELQEQQKLFVHMVSHDLRTPLTLISGHAELVEDALAHGEMIHEVHESVEAIRRSVQRMTAMIGDLVDVARLEGGQLQLQRQPVELPAYLAELLHRSATALDVPRIQVEMPADLPPISADCNRLERILANLLSNALKYSAAGTPVQVRARHRGTQVEVTVEDRGNGIAPEHLPHLFERFYRVIDERQTEGTGLGLYITRLLVEAHGGQIWVVSTVGKGSQFVFTLPVAAGEGERCG
jgi:PAS domain S-box-containing protein